MLTVLRLYLTFFRIGILGFGGGMAILPLIYQNVQQFDNIDPETFANLFAISQATPGPIAVNAATFVGFNAAGTGGAAAATIGVASPSFILVILVIRFISKYRDNKLVNGAFLGIRPAAVGMIAAGVIFMGQTALFSIDLEEVVSLSEGIENIQWIPLAMAVATVILAGKFKVSAVKLIIIMGVLGGIFCSGIININI